MIIITPTAQAATAQASDASQGEELRRANAESLKGERAAPINSVAIMTSKGQHANTIRSSSSQNMAYKQTNITPKFKVIPAPEGHTFQDLPATLFQEEDKENRRPNYSVRPTRTERHKLRHHNPGTKYRPDPRLHRPPARRVRLLSSVQVVPPRCISPIPATSNQPSTSREHRQYQRPKINQIADKWRKPRRLHLPIINSIWRRERALVPASEADYRYGFKIFPGKAYQTVPWYEDHDATWPPRPIATTEPTRPQFYDASNTDPRSLDLRVHLQRLRIDDLRNHLNKKRNVETSQKEDTQPQGGKQEETPEEAIARLHGEALDNQPSTSKDAERTPGLTNEPWPIPGRRRRRCRLIIIYDKPEPRTNRN